MEQYKEYKDSGVKWIGEIPKHWNVTKVSRLYNIQLGKMLQPTKQNENDILCDYICAANVGKFKLKLDMLKQMWFSKSDLSIYEIKKGDLLVVEGGDIASCDIVNIDVDNLYIQNAIHRVRSKSFCLVKFLRYFIMRAKYVGHIDKICNKATISHFTKDKFCSLNFAFPNQHEQQTIVSYLDNKVSKIDKYISTAEKKIAAFDELKQVTIADAVTHGTNPNAPMKDSDIPWIGMVPEHWEVNKIRSLFKLSNQKTSDPNCTLLSLSQYTGVRLKSECANVGMFEAETTIGYNIVQKGQFIMNIMLAWNGSYSVSNYNGVISPAYCVFDFIRNCDKKYFDYLLRLKAYSGAFKTLSKGLIDSRLRLYPDYFKTFPIVIPPVEEQNEIVAYIDRKVAQIDKMKAAELAQIDKLKEYKQRLISDVVTGKVKVTNE